MKNNDNLVELVFTLVLVAVFGLVAFTIGNSLGKSELRKKLIKQGVAEWSSDETGNPVFKIKKICLEN
jgi:hypothetical protein